MSRFNSFLKKIIKTISGYKIQSYSHGSFVLARENIEMKFLYPASLLLTDIIEKTDDDLKETRGIYDYLRQLRLKKILEKYQINIILDVGANKGQFAKELRRIN